jgi:hypothetical protein
MEKQDAVVAITSGTSDLAGVMSLVWEHILPAIATQPLPEDKASVTKLRQKLAGLTLPPQAGDATKPLAAQVSGKRYVFPANDAKLESVVVEFGADGAVIRLRQDGKDTRIPAGRTWQRGETLLTLGVPEKVAGTGAWTATTLSPRSSRPTRRRSSRRSRSSGRARSCESTPSTTSPSASASARSSSGSSSRSS